MRCFAPGRRPKRCSVCTLLKFRALGVGHCTPGEVQRFDFCLLRQMLCLESNTFKRVWVKNSKTPVFYGRGRVYFDNYTLCYSCHGAIPKLLYKLPAHAALEKIEDALFCETPVYQVLSPSDYRPSIVGLTSSNFLLRFDADTGQILEKIFLSHVYKFKQISWISEQETLMLKSIRSKPPDQPRTIFGSTVTDVTVSENILITLHSNGTVKFYNLEEIVNKYKVKELSLGGQCEWDGKHGIVGSKAFGIPCNIQVTAHPSLLFEAKCHLNEMSIGGFPWHYIITPSGSKNRGVFHVHSLEDGTLAHGGVLNMDGCFLEDDWVMFHPDNSSRICQVSLGRFDMLRLSTLKNGKTSLHREFSVSTKQDERPELATATSSYGRLIKKRFSQFDVGLQRKTIQLVDYEDELDLIIVAVVSDAESSGDAVIHLHDNSTGQRLKSIPLQGPWDVTVDQHLYVDQDTIIHMTQSVNRKTICQVYKLTQTLKESLPRISSQPHRRVKMRLDNG
uniref:DDB1- and CUL4-associated factor 17-like isoform X2 n=1 Tax=Myxine glutinosa TaxID=7769 RepID=UPI00358F87E0